MLSNFRRVLNVVCFLLGNSPASEFYMLTFGTLCLFRLHRQVGVPTCLWRCNRQSVPKRRHIKFRSRGITQKKAYNIFLPWTIQEIEHTTHIPVYFLFRFNGFCSPDQIQKRRNSLIGYDSTVSCNYVIINCGCKGLLFVIIRLRFSFRFKNFLFYSTRSRRDFRQEVRSFVKIKKKKSNWNFNPKIMTTVFCNLPHLWDTFVF